MATLEINNFHGSLTPYLYGDINSGLGNGFQNFGQEPFNKPNNLTWAENPVQIDPTGSVITDLIVCGKERNESGINYAYCVGHTGRVYKIQVNNPSSYNSDYDNPVLLTTLTINSPTFTRGGYIDFYGSTQKIYIGHDMGVTSIAFDGSGESFIGVLGSWVQNVPRKLKQFLGKLYIANGKNIAEFDSTLTVTTYTKLSPGFPDNTQVRDIDMTPDGNYMQLVVTELALGDITSPDTSNSSPSNSYVFKWNGTDNGYTSFVTYPNTSLTANALFGNYQYVFGYDLRGGGIYNPIERFITSTPDSAWAEAPYPNSVIAYSNLITWIATFPFEGKLQLIYCYYGLVSSFEYQKPGFWCPLAIGATAPETDIVHIPCQILVSNYGQGSSSNGYSNQIFSKPKIYFSTVETSSAPTTKYRFYKWHPVTIDDTNVATGAVYQTQTQLFSKKIAVSNVRVYGEPWITGNAFTIDLIGSDGNPIPNASKSFVAGTNMKIGEDFAWYGPNHKPTYALGLRVTNDSNINCTINKVEIDYNPAGV